jgi:DNA-directed RNA polymerase specialized sigma24 family protein
MEEILKGLLLLPAGERDTVAMRYAGMKYRDIAEAQGVTMSCVEKRHRSAMRRWPVLRELFPLKACKQKRRKKHTEQD